MGWNDISKLVLVFAIFFAVTNIYSQPEAKSGAQDQLPPAYILKGIFRTHIYNNYLYSDTTIVRRTYVDSTELSYKRIVNYYLTIFQPDPPDSKGFWKIDVSIDSIHYVFEEGDTRYEFTSLENFDPKVFNFDDFKTVSIPMSKEFTIEYSPYGEIVKIEGERLDYFRDYVEKSFKDSPDSISYYYWTDGLSDERLAHIADVFKIIYPINPVYQDSLWTTPIYMNIDGIIVRDTIVGKVKGLYDNNYVIEGMLTQSFILPKKVKFYNLPYLDWTLSITKSIGSFAQYLSTSGTMKEMKINLDLEIEAGRPKQVFTQSISKRMHWELTNQFRFK